jgi:hypothetical protein
MIFFPEGWNKVSVVKEGEEWLFLNCNGGRLNRNK